MVKTTLPASLYDVQAAFYLLGFGLVVCSIIFVTEMLSKYWNNNWKFEGFFYINWWILQTIYVWYIYVYCYLSYYFFSCLLFGD